MKRPRINIYTKAPVRTFRDFVDKRIATGDSKKSAIRKQQFAQLVWAQ